eukprot:964171-Pelagomonas_calceolata.AAC.2
MLMYSYKDLKGRGLRSRRGLHGAVYCHYGADVELQGFVGRGLRSRRGLHGAVFCNYDADVELQGLALYASGDQLLLATRAYLVGMWGSGAAVYYQWVTKVGLCTDPGLSILFGGEMRLLSLLRSTCRTMPSGTAVLAMDNPFEQPPCPAQARYTSNHLLVLSPSPLQHAGPCPVALPCWQWTTLLSSPRAPILSQYSSIQPLRCLPLPCNMQDHAQWHCRAGSGPPFCAAHDYGQPAALGPGVPAGWLLLCQCRELGAGRSVGWLVAGLEQLNKQDLKYQLNGSPSQ